MIRALLVACSVALFSGPTFALDCRDCIPEEYSIWKAIFWRSYTPHGEWIERSTCALGTGWIEMAHKRATYSVRSSGEYHGTIVDLLGRRGTIKGAVDGQSFYHLTTIGGYTQRVSGTISADGKSMTSSTNDGCSTVSKRIR